MNAQTIVVVLDANGSQELYCGWRVELIFQGRWEASPSEVADATSRKLGASLQVHALIEDDDRRFVVLRWSTAYAYAFEAAARAKRDGPTAARKRCELSLVRGEAERRPERRASVGQTSGTFTVDQVTRVAARNPFAACEPTTTRGCG
jgi:hypothetical protein